MIALNPGLAALSQLENIWCSGSAAILDPNAKPKVMAAADLVAKAAADSEAVYVLGDTA